MADLFYVQNAQGISSRPPSTPGQRALKRVTVGLLVLAVSAVGIDMVFASGQPVPAAPITAQTVRTPAPSDSPQGSN